MTDHRARPTGDRIDSSADTDRREVEDEQLAEAIFGDEHPSARVADILADEAAHLVADLPPGDPVGHGGHGRHAAPERAQVSDSAVVPGGGGDPAPVTPADGGSPRRVRITPPEAQAEVSADDGEKDDEPISIADAVREQLGGLRGLVESSLPVLVFIVVNMTTSLKPALWAAVGSAALIAAYRLIRRDSVRHALNGLFAVGIAAFIAARTGQAEDFYLLNIARNSGGALLCAGSVLFRRPVIGYAWRFIAEIPPAWRESKGLMRAFSLISLVWALMFAIRAGVQIWLWSQSNADALGWASLAMGWPMFGACLVFTIWYGRRAIAADAERTAAVG
ncbi:DUF3159 domain-containing protein [Cryptosporangium aurantiacum]|uniref:Intracellular septation protein A n=1 Tax=Cryptosporangium aurantiacum TaxID=134849 RepID=A0A1M7J3G0_9ACTN|nr:DUF3159 domain-containing protein [Cryptosporangium aurantiacum]SHM47452.1 Intracellular septation protein A [Cryptosporangium aurantiacum]